MKESKQRIVNSLQVAAIQASIVLLIRFPRRVVAQILSSACRDYDSGSHTIRCTVRSRSISWCIFANPCFECPAVTWDTWISSWAIQSKWPNQLMPLIVAIDMLDECNCWISRAPLAVPRQCCDSRSRRCNSDELLFRRCLRRWHSHRRPNCHSWSHPNERGSPSC